MMYNYSQTIPEQSFIEYPTQSQVLNPLIFLTYPREEQLLLLETEIKII